MRGGEVYGESQECKARKVISEVYTSLGANVNTRRMSKPDMGSIIHIKNQWNILVIGNYYVNYQNFQNLMLLTSSDTKRTLMHLFLFANSGQRELVSICTQSIHGRNKLSLHYILDFPHTPPLLSFLSLLLKKKLFSKKTPNLT